MKKSKFIIPNLFLVLVFIFCSLLSGCSVAQEKEKEPAQSNTQKVVPTEETFTVSRGSIGDWYTETVDISADDLHLKFNQTGFIKTISCKDNDQVKKGDLLAELDTNKIQTKIKTAKLDLEKAKIKLKNFQAIQTNITDVDLEIALKKMQQLGEQYEHAIGRYGIFPTEEEQRKIDLILLQLEKAKIEYNGMLEKKSGQTPDIELAKETITKLESQIAQLNATLADHQISAPCNGIISNIDESCAIGKSISSNKTAITMVNTDQLKLFVNPPKDSAFLKNARTDFFLEAFAVLHANWDKPYKAQIIPTIDPVTKEIDEDAPYQLKLLELPLGIKENGGYYCVDGSVINDSGEILEKNFTYKSGVLTCQIKKNFIEDTLYIPTLATQMIADGTNKTANVTVLENNKKIERIVVLNGIFDRYVSVESGLKEGDVVVYYAY